MSAHTHIEWTDATWNIITGCSVVSAGCKHCYAMKLAGTRLQHHPSRAGLTVETSAGPVWNGQVRFNEQWLKQPLEWRRSRLIFPCAHGDLFHESVPFEWIDQVVAVMAVANWHTYQVLTKRAASMAAYFSDPATLGRILQILAKWRETTVRCELEQVDDGLPGFSLPNVWLGVSAENQQTADERIPHLLKMPAARRWVSLEPLLGPIDLTSIRREPCDYGHAHKMLDSLTGEGVVAGSDGNEEYVRRTRYYPRGLDWVVVGGESGTSSRPAHPAWFRSLRDQCNSVGVPFLFKQWGDWVSVSEVAGAGRHHTFPDGARVRHVGKRRAGRRLDGALHDGYPPAPGADAR